VNALPATPGPGPVVEHADALDWLAVREPGSATAVIYDPPYAVGSPVRGREDGAAGSVFGPLSFLSRTMSLCARALRPGGIVIIFTDYKRMADMGYIASTVGLRPAACVAWVRNRPGTGGLLRASWDPVLVVSRGVPDAVDRAAIRNVVTADYPARRSHPYEKPAASRELPDPADGSRTRSPGSWGWSGAAAISMPRSRRRRCRELHTAAVMRPAGFAGH
jgi:hypothetical protein